MTFWMRALSDRPRKLTSVKTIMGTDAITISEAYTSVPPIVYRCFHNTALPKILRKIKTYAVALSGIMLK